MQKPLASRPVYSLLPLTLVLATLSPAATLPRTPLPSHPPLPAHTALDEVQDLVERVRRERHKVSVDVFKSLAKNKDKAGLQALESCIDLLGSKSDPDVGSGALRHAFKALGNYKGVQKLESRVIRFLVKEIVDESFMRGLHARNTLVSFNPAAAVVVEKALLKAKNPMARARLLGALMPTLSQRGDAPALKLIFEHAQFPYSFLENRLIEGLASFKCEGLGRVLKSKNTSLVTAALDALHSRGEWGPASQLKRLANSKNPQERLRAMRNLASLPDSKNPAKWISKIARGIDSKEAPERRAATDVLQELATPFAVQALAALLEYKDENARGEALAALLACRSKESLSAIFRAYENEAETQLQQQAHAVLCDLTGLDWGAAPARWRKWWDDKGANGTRAVSPASPSTA